MVNTSASNRSNARNKQESLLQDMLAIAAGGNPVQNSSSETTSQTDLLSPTIDPSSTTLLSNQQLSLATESSGDNISFNNYTIQSHDPRQDIRGQFSVLDNGNSLSLQGNTWKRIGFDYNITANTLLEFSFKSTARGEIHGIGFDNDNTASSNLSFALHGTERWGRRNFANYVSAPKVDGWANYLIEVGRFFTGSMRFLTFINDHDVNNPTANSFFSNVRVYERLQLQNDTASVNEDNTLILSPGNLLGNDVGTSLRITGVTNGVNGTASLNSQGNVVFTPNGNFNGVASFNYVVSDRDGKNANATVRVTVNPVNDAPIAVDDFLTTDADRDLVILPSSLLSNDTDVDGDILRISSVSDAINGSVVLDSQGNIVFRPNTNFYGDASFDYTISDLWGGIARAKARVKVNRINNSPIALDDTGATDWNSPVTFLATELLENDSDPDGDILRLSSVANPINGSVALDAQGNPVFTPNNNFSGDASFEYVVSDPNGGTARATVKVTVNPQLPSPGNPPVTLPDLSTRFAPVSTPALPSGSDIFALAFVGSVSGASGNLPAIAEWTRTAGNGNTIVLTGWQFSNLTGASAGSDTKFWVYGQTASGNGTLQQATVQKLDGDIAAITLPSTLPQGSAYLLWAQNGSGYSAPVMINQTESWWIQERGTRGQVVSIFGRNLSQDNGTNRSNVYLEDGNGRGYWAPVVAVNPYKIDFKVPDALANGDYKVYVHNGDGGQYGWSKPLTMTVNDGLNYTGSVFNVKDFGAKGDGITDDTAAIKAALSAADKQPWATVYLPEGTYMISEALNPGWSQVRWLGDGKDLTSLKVANGSTQAMLFNATSSARSQITFENLTLDGNKTNAVNIGNVVLMRAATDINYLNIRINAEGAHPFDWHGGKRISMQNSEIIGKSGFLGTASQVFIDNTQFFGTNYTNAILAGFGVQEISITNSVAQNLDTSDPNNGKWAKGRFFVDQPHWRNSRYQYIGDNQTIDMAPPPATGIDRNSGEQIMWEYTSGSHLLNTVTNITSDTISVATAPVTNGNWILTIVSGKGIGQSRSIQSFNSSTNTYQLSNPWNVIPDNSSVILASRMVAQAVVYGNSLDGTTEAYNSPSHIASAGVQAYYGGTDLIIDNNTFHELRSSVSLWSGGVNLNRFTPAYFTQVTNNTVQDSLTGIAFPWISGRVGTNILGTTIQDNSFDNVKTGIHFRGNPREVADGSSFPNANMNIIEHNTVGSVGTFLNISQVNDNIHNTILLNNTSLDGSLIPSSGMTI